MEKIYKAALIGCGKMGKVHIQEIYNQPNVHFTYVCDRDLERAEYFKARYNANQAVTDYMDCVNDPEVDIIIVATLPASHLEIVRAALANKKHVLCEKPVTASKEEGAEFLKLVQDNPDSKVLIGHILRFNETYCKAAEMIRGGAIGHPINFRMVQNHHAMDWPRYLAILKEASPIVDCGVHYADVAQWITGQKIVEVKAFGMRMDEDVPEDRYNYGLVSLKMADGSMGYYEAGYSKTLAASNIKQFAGPKGRISIIYAKDRSCHQEEGDLIEWYQYPEKTYTMINVPGKRKPTDAQFQHLINMIENDVPAQPTMEEVMEAFYTMLEADELIRASL